MFGRGCPPAASVISRAWRGRTQQQLTAGSLDDLAVAAAIAPSYLSEIETRRKPGSFGALAKLATALHISLDDLAAWLDPPQQ
jgi:transcriptional regulator with XRE-family HTH domain